MCDTFWMSPQSVTLWRPISYGMHELELSGNTGIGSEVTKHVGGVKNRVVRFWVYHRSGADHYSSHQTSHHQLVMTMTKYH